MKKLIKLIKSGKKIFISIASHPGKVGMNFYNPLFKKFKLNMIYTAIKTNSLNEVFKLIRQNKISGCSVSMPHKNKVYKFLDYFDHVSKKTKIINTILNKNGKLYGYNCDFLAIKKIFSKYKIKKNQSILIYGSGSTTRILVYFLTTHKYKNFFIKARNNKKISKICNIKKLKKSSDENYNILINTSSLGMKGYPQKIMFNKKQIKNASIVVDFVNKPKETKLIKYAKLNKKKCCNGIEISSYQFLNQFKLYTGKKLSNRFLLKYN